MKKKKVSISGIIKWVIALFLVIMQVYPFFYVFTSSFKSLDDFRKLPAYALPSKWVLTNFINVFTKSHMLTYFKNSIIVLIGVLIPLLLFALMAGFALSKIKFKGRKFVLNYFLLGLMLPMQVALIPLFTIFNKMGLINTYPAIILPQIAFSLSYSIQLFYSFNKFFPEEMLEAAREVTGKEIPAEIAPRRAGDPSRLVASSEKAREILGWKPEYTDIKAIIKTAWDWHVSHPNGYEE